jgi:acetyltransferase-like isoleucine patch superfamily enzyme
VALGLIVYDLLYLTLAALLYGGAAFAAVRAQAALSAPAPLASYPLAALAGLLTLIAEVAALSALCPRLRPGKYTMLKGAVFWGWILRSMLRRILLLPSIKWVLFNSNLLRWLALHAMGARVAFTSSISSDVELLDPSLTVIGAGAVLGARCAIACHYVENGQLILGEVRIGARALLAGEVGVGPGAVIGERAFIKVRTAISLRAVIGAGAHVGPGAWIDKDAVVTENARIGTLQHVKAGDEPKTHAETT